MSSFSKLINLGKFDENYDKWFEKINKFVESEINVNLKDNMKFVNYKHTVDGI